jgi:CheY-like chemotaxis protein
MVGVMKRKRILVVDDDPVVQKVLHAMLQTIGDTVVTGDAIAATAEARKNKPDLVILDLGLPAGGGFAVLQRLKATPALSLTPVLIISGLDRAANEHKALSAGASAYLEKPIKQEEVLRKVHQLLGER